jgi:hypothetical protein
MPRLSFEYLEGLVTRKVLFSRSFLKYCLSKILSLRISIRDIVLPSVHTVLTAVKDS